MKTFYLIMCVSCVTLGIVIGTTLSSRNADGVASSANAQSAITQPAATQPAASATVGWQASPAPAPAPTTEEQTNIFVYEHTNPSVANISTVSVHQDFFRQFHAQGLGSGAVLDKQGHIITNFHVVDGADEIEVTLASNDSFRATLVGADKEHDIAVLKIDAPGEALHPIDLGSSSNLKVGQRVFALGNPFGWDGTLTTGIISSLNRDLPSRVPGRNMKALIQTDAAMNPGNSGGPLVNTQGQMIGMCVAIATKAGQNAGVGFAIPIDRIKLFVPELLDNGRVVRANIGIAEVVETGEGLVVRRLVQNGPAEQAGLQGYRKIVTRRRQGGLTYESTIIDRSKADRILAVDGEQVRTGVRFRDKIWEYEPGDVVQLTLLRDGQKIEVAITLGAD